MSERPGNVPIPVLLRRLKQALENARREFEENDYRNAKAWIDQAIGVLDGRKIW